MNLGEMLSYIDNYLGDSDRVDFPEKERVMYINNEFLYLYSKFYEHAGIELSNVQTITGNIPQGSNEFLLDSKNASFKEKEVYVDNVLYKPFVRGIDQSIDSDVPVGYYIRQFDKIILAPSDKDRTIKIVIGSEPQLYDVNNISGELTKEPYPLHEQAHILLPLSAMRSYYTSRELNIPNALVEDYNRFYKLAEKIIENKKVFNKGYTKPTFRYN